MPLPSSKTPAEPARPRLRRPCRRRPRSTQTEGLSGYIISRLTQGFSIRCLRFTSDVAAAHAKLASGWRAAPLPGGSRFLLTQGSSTPSRRSAARPGCSPTHRAASPIRGSSPSATTKSLSTTRTTAAAGDAKSCASPRTSSSAVSCCTCCPTASTASLRLSGQGRPRRQARTRPRSPRRAIERRAKRPSEQRPVLNGFRRRGRRAAVWRLRRLPGVRPPHAPHRPPRARQRQSVSLRHVMRTVARSRSTLAPPPLSAAPFRKRRREPLRDHALARRSRPRPAPRADRHHRPARPRLAASAPANLTPTASDPRPERPTPTRHRVFPIAPNDPRLRSIRLM